MKTKRQISRTAAFQILYEIDLLTEAHQVKLHDDQSELHKFIENHFEHFQIPKNAREFCIQLVKLTLQNFKTIDLKIQEKAKNWQISRMPPIDRNILRLSCTELFYIPETPHEVVLNEAIEISKEFGSEESSKFINGVLDSLLQSKS